jgi:hypothetical protein
MGLTAGNKRNVAPTPIEKRNATLFFQGFDLLGHRRLGEQQLLGCAAEVKVMRNRAKYFEPEILHLLSLNIPASCSMSLQAKQFYSLALTVSITAVRLR